MKNGWGIRGLKCVTFMILVMLSVDKRTRGSWLGPCETLISEVSIGIRYSEISLKDASHQNDVRTEQSALAPVMLTAFLIILESSPRQR